MKLNGSDYKKSFLLHNDLMNGGKLEFNMAATAPQNQLEAPSTSINDNAIVPAPYVDCESKVFRGKQKVALKCLDNTATIYVRKNILADELAKPYREPFEINNNVTIDFYAMRNDGSKSATIESSFLKIPEGRYIKLNSKYDNQYTAGGDEALIDGVHGDTNWRKGGWQGYPGNTLEAIVDLGKSLSISKVGLGCLQDIGPWIFYPNEITFAVSDDNINFATIATIRPERAIENAPVTTKDFTQDVTSQGRYVKVIARPFGKLPEWHISVGETAWLFVDEILITAK